MDSSEDASLDVEVKGRLFIVATPIGNLEDITLRAANVLKSVPIIAAEDTRRSGHLLTHLGARPERLISLHDHNESSRSAEVIDCLRDGVDVALISDAGTPLVSDPGFELVRGAHQAGLTVVPIPGASALMAAVSASPVPVDRFLFEGFLPSRRIARRRRLAELAEFGIAIVFFESPRRITDTLSDVGEVIGWDRRLVVARELTKLHEEVVCESVQQLSERGAEAFARGELVCVLEGVEGIGQELGAQTRGLVQALCEELSPAQASRLAARATGLAKGPLYQYALSLRRRDDSK